MPHASATHAGARDPLSLILRAEGLGLLLLGVLAYEHLGGSWSQFALLLLLPDLAMLGYLLNSRWGALAYNATHSTLGPVVLVLIGATGSASLWWPLAAIWLAHIGLDRVLGYGLKRNSGFRDTHLGRIGRLRTDF